MELQAPGTAPPAAPDAGVVPVEVATGPEGPYMEPVVASGVPDVGLGGVNRPGLGTGHVVGLTVEAARPVGVGLEGRRPGAETGAP